MENADSGSSPLELLSGSEGDGSWEADDAETDGDALGDWDCEMAVADRTGFRTGGFLSLNPE